MKLWTKIAAAAVGVVVVAVAAVPLFVNVNTFRPLLEEQLTTALGRQVKLGTMSLSLFAGNVTANDLSIADDPQFGSTPFLSAKVLNVGVEMSPLIFNHKILVRSLSIDSPKIHLVHAASGTWNFSSIGQAAANRTPEQKQQSVAPDLTVDKLRITNGHVTVESLPAKGEPLVYDQLAMNVDNFAFAKQFSFTLSANLPGQGTLSLTGKAGPIDPHDASLTAFDVQMALHHFDPVAAGFLDKSAGFAMLADIDSHASSNGSVVSSDGTIHAQNLRLRPNAVPTPKPVDINYKVSHNLADNTGQLSDATFQTGKLSGHLSGTYSLQPTTTVNMKLVGDSMPVNELQAMLPAVGVQLPNGTVLQGGTLTTSLAITGPLENLAIAGPVQLNNTRLSGFNLSSQLKGIAGAAIGDTGNMTDFQTIRTQLSLNNAGVKADNIYVNMPAIGEAVGSGTVSPSNALNFRLSMKVNTSRGIGGKAVGLLTALNGAAGKTAAQAAANGVPVTITGTASNPVITPDVGGMLKNNASSLLGGQKQSGQGVINKLGGLFGKH
jgi:AsmA protein